MNDGSRVVLRIEAVTKTFPGVRALNDVTFDVKAGEVHGLVGENGAGKSTLMGVASGALVPDQGSVTIDGTAVSGDPKHSRELGLAIVRQEPSLMPDLTVAENIYLGLPLGKRPAISAMAAWTTELMAAWDRQDTIHPNDLVSALNPEKRFI
ncbi:MAG: sugar ABC transporter ATP-binding protein, partial [Candidatus Eremiobacteraeota bacterium]|nr:sugar ABC transporter ATP-binding protein [Candidatus Eremiobacteraeota bacterium]